MKRKSIGLLNEMLSRRTRALAAAKRQAQWNILRRKEVEAALQKSRQHFGQLLKDSMRLQKSLRGLAHKVMGSQENERKKISLQLQDEVAQTLLGINVQLLILKHTSCENTQNLDNEIATTRRLVIKSARVARRTAREFRGHET